MLYVDDNSKLELSQKLKSDASCDYKWHDINISFMDSHLSLHIDELKPIEQKIQNIPKDFGFAEIYIGGRPGKKHLHLLMTYNFKWLIVFIKENKL